MTVDFWHPLKTVCLAVMASSTLYDESSRFLLCAPAECSLWLGWHVCPWSCWWGGGEGWEAGQAVVQQLCPRGSSMSPVNGLEACELAPATVLPSLTSAEMSGKPRQQPKIGFAITSGSRGGNSRPAVQPRGLGERWVCIIPVETEGSAVNSCSLPSLPGADSSR